MNFQSDAMTYDVKWELMKETANNMLYKFKYENLIKVRCQKGAIWICTIMKGFQKMQMRYLDTY